MEVDMVAKKNGGSIYFSLPAKARREFNIQAGELFRVSLVRLEVKIADGGAQHV